MTKEEDILDLYSKEAANRGLSANCTMPDDGVRELEVNILKKHINLQLTDFTKTLKILEVGCGNGYTVEQIAACYPRYFFHAVDINSDMINLCLQRHLDNVTFNVTSVKDIKEDNFDIVYTERCLMNLVSWEDQKEALNKIHNILKKDGILLLIETFISGWEMLNRSREVLGVKAIPVPWQSTPFVDDKFDMFIKGKYKHIKYGNDDNFLSSYYYGARILYPALIESRKEIVYNNPFIEFFKHIPSILNYSPVQLRILRKI